MGRSNFSTIFLSQGKQAIVDNEDFEWLSQWKWTLHSEGYAFRNNHVGIGSKTILMHKVINNTPEGMVTDHINQNRLDNRKANLRSVTKSQNGHNTKISKNNTSDFNGVIYHPKNKRWVAQITVNYKNVYIGIYETKREAKIARDAANIILQNI